MKTRKNLFNASFEQSEQIVPNLFTDKPFFYDFANAESMEFFKRLFVIVVVLIFDVMSYGIGVACPELISEDPFAEGGEFISDSIIQGIAYFTFLKPIIYLSLIVWTILVIINIFPKKDYSVQRAFGALNLIMMIVTTIYFCSMPMLLGVCLGALGWFGFGLVCLYGVLFLFSSSTKKSNEIKNELYGQDTFKNEDSTIIKFWNFIQRFWLIVLILIIVNVIFFRFGMWGEKTIWSVWGILGPVYFLLVTGFSYGFMELFVSTFYFVKYSKQYKEEWQPTDEEWYGKRKAKKMAKKKK
ncbi:hypothetical protein [Floricoccus penangensis]|uniref:hypothetical protein n=1 Tax=Floricoccus penangensis TaxID=1859475 RepID=UPI00203C40FA|nr:hypothetical protein [Floricoccus penangensis]URZ88146.1 hypothetical protein KIW23_03685 [Floricoccus penangensis]